MQYSLAILLLFAASVHAAELSPEASRLGRVHEESGNPAARDAQLKVLASDRRLERLDQRAANLAATDFDVEAATALEGEYAREVQDRQRNLVQAEDILLTGIRPLPEGGLVDLSDPVFDESMANLGMYSAGTFRQKVGGGIYMLEPYRPGVDVLLMVHGIHATPRCFQKLAERLAGGPFQVWIAYYPTGEKMDQSADLIQQSLARMLQAHPVKRVVMLAHSMGGLVFRELLCRHPLPQLAATYYVSTPHRGVRFICMPAVRIGVRVLWRFMPPQIYDLLEGSAYLQALNRQPPPDLPRRTAIGNEAHIWRAKIVTRLIPGADDGLVPGDSAPYAGLEHRVYPAEDHYSILPAPDFAQMFRQWLATDLQ
jgi:pimeloyl-ACP methyl ester carboxylesterase